MKPSELKAHLANVIKKLEKGEIEIEEAKAVVSASNAICKVVSTEIVTKEFNQKHKEKVGF